MDIAKKHNSLGYSLLLFIYKVLGYKAVSFILNFVALYYVLFARKVKVDLESFYNAQNIKLTNKIFFKHIKSFATSLLDRFVSRINPEDFTYNGVNQEYLDTFKESGGIVLLSHFGGWASSTHNLSTKNIPPMNVVMQDNTNKSMQEVEADVKDENKQNVKIIDVNQGAFATNIQIANVLMQGEIVAMMADRVADEKRKIKVKFFSKDVYINKDPFDIAKRMNKPMIVVHTINKGSREYEARYYKIDSENNTLEENAQNYMDILEEVVKEYPYQWYNFYDYFI
ncbi:MAG: lysophospholipid acyltransferase family protein [Thiovulaceae bacterium]|nr:lysophospholipid acyltransferase family protein [Sulfurimonadaceae bacterium]